MILTDSGADGGVADLLLPVGALVGRRSSLNSGVSISGDELNGPISSDDIDTLPHATVNNRRWPGGRSGLVSHPLQMPRRSVEPWRWSFRLAMADSGVGEGPAGRFESAVSSSASTWARAAAPC